MLVPGSLIRLHKAVVAGGVEHPVSDCRARHQEVAHAVAGIALHGVRPGVVAVQVERLRLAEGGGKRRLNGVDHDLAARDDAYPPALALMRKGDAERGRIRAHHQAGWLHMRHALLAIAPVPAHAEGRLTE